MLHPKNIYSLGLPRDNKFGPSESNSVTLPGPYSYPSEQPIPAHKPNVPLFTNMGSPAAMPPPFVPRNSYYPRPDATFVPPQSGIGIPPPPPETPFSFISEFTPEGSTPEGSTPEGSTPVKGSTPDNTYTRELAVAIDKYVPFYKGKFGSLDIRDYLYRISQIESSGGHTKDREGSEYVGPFQIGTSVRTEFERTLEDTLTTDGNTKIALELSLKNFKYLSKNLGREPTGPELYFAHQQGRGGASLLLASPDELAQRVTSLKAISGNLPPYMSDQAPEMTSKGFTNYYTEKYTKKTKPAPKLQSFYFPKPNPTPPPGPPPTLIDYHPNPDSATLPRPYSPPPRRGRPSEQPISVHKPYVPPFTNRGFPYGVAMPPQFTRVKEVTPVKEFTPVKAMPPEQLLTKPAVPAIKFGNR